MIRELKNVSGAVVAKIIICGLCYLVTESLIFTILLKKEHHLFHIYHGIIGTFYAAFYRVPTFGSGTAAAQVYYFSTRGIDPSVGLSAATLQYVFHKSAISVYAGLGFLLCSDFMNRYFADYRTALLLGFFLTFFICSALILVCVSDRFHTFLGWIWDRADRKGTYQKQKNTALEKCRELRRETKQFSSSVWRLVMVTLLEFVKLSFQYLIPFIILEPENGSVFEIMCVMALVLALSGVIPAPGGLGSTDGLIVLFFSQIVDPAQALSVMVLYRFATYLIPFLIGMIPAAIVHKNTGGVLEMVHSHQENGPG